MQPLKLFRHAREVFEVPRDLLLGRYPEFVTGGGLPKGHVPVFVFHSLEPESFARKLGFLAENGYVTLSVEEYFLALMNARPAPERAVLLTIDDGRASVYSVGYPLLARHGMKAVVFLVPSRIGDEPARPLAAGAARRLLAAPPPNEGFLSWPEVEFLARSGLVDFESHSLSHARVHTRPQIVDFFCPDLRRGYRSLDAPLVHDGARDLPAGQVPLGTPLLASEPRLSDQLRFYEDPAIRAAPVAAVAKGGGEAFFDRSDWRRRLRRLVRGRPLSGRIETPTERDSAILYELAESKRLIEEHTGRAVTQLCYPWHVSGEAAERLAREVGYRTAYAGKVRGVPLTLPGGDPLRIARIGEDYVETLPGRGRADLLSILRLKWQRRLSGKA